MKVLVLDKNQKVLFEGPISVAPEWICGHPVSPHYVVVAGGMMTVDDFMDFLEVEEEFF